MQFSIVVIVSVIVGYFVIFAVSFVAAPLFEYLFENYSAQIVQELYEAEEELKKEVKLEDTIISENESFPEIEAVISRYPQYQFSYEVFVDQSINDIHRAKNTPKIMESYATTYLQAKNGVVVVGVIVPEIARWGIIVAVIVIILYVLVLLGCIGFYVGRKARYLKMMTTKLELMSGGDLNIRVPVKGKDELSQLAWHINEMTTALRDRIQKEKEVEDTKKQFITNISHDLRTPLTAVLGYLSLLEKMNPIDEAEKMKLYIHTVHQRSEGISHLVDQLFDYVLLSNHQMEFKYFATEPSVLFHQLFSDSESLIRSKNCNVVYRLNPSPKIWIDVNQLKRVSDNMMQNIEKYGIKGSEVYIEGERHHQGYVLKLTNTSEALLDFQGEDFLGRYFTTDRTSGKSAGLGLAICKEIIEQHDGTFTVITEGNQFKMIITLPYIKEVE